MKIILSSLLLISFTLQASTLEDIRIRSELVCGIHGSLHGLSYISEHKMFEGFDVDFCRAVAAVVLKDKSAVEFVPLTSKVRFSALENGEVDLLARNSTWTYSRDTLNIEFVGISFYDGQSFLVRKDKNIKTLKDIKPGASVCSVKGTSTSENLKSYSSKLDLNLNIIEEATKANSEMSFFGGRCDLFASDITSLMSIRHVSAIKADEFDIISPTISKEPLGPVVRDSDPNWTNIVRWTLFGLIEAEEQGISMHNIDSFKNSPNIKVRYMLGIDPGIGDAVGLDDQWLVRAIKAVGNYGEIYHRNFGPKSKTHMDRGLNALWRDGGLLYAPPFK